MHYKNKNVIVTGGAGFIGSHLVERLLKDGHKVTVLDNLSTGRLENLDRVKDEPSLGIHHVNVANYSKIKQFFNGIDWVFHLAALADIVPSIQKPVEYHMANVDGTISTLEASRLAGIKKFIYAASSSCYGIPERYPTPETEPPKPLYPYALTKYIGECYVFHWSRIYRLPVTSLRLFNVYGPRSRTTGAYGAVFGVFLAQKLAGQPFTVVGDGNQKRDFVFVTDAIDALIMAAESDVKDEVFNVGSGTSYTINRLIKLLGGDVISIPKRPGEPDCTQADISKIKNILNWNPKINFEEGVKIMLNNIKYWKRAPLWTPAKIEEETRDWFKYISKN